MRIDNKIISIIKEWFIYKMGKPFFYVLTVFNKKIHCYHVWIHWGEKYV